MCTGLCLEPARCWRAPSDLWGRPHLALPCSRDALTGGPGRLCPPWALSHGGPGGLLLLLPSHTACACCVLPTETHPRPPKPDPVKSVSGVLGGLTPAKSAPVINNGSPTILGKRSYEQHNGVDGESLVGRPGGASTLSRRGLLALGCPAPSLPGPRLLTVFSLPLSPVAGRWQAT